MIGRRRINGLGGVGMEVWALKGGGGRDIAMKVEAWGGYGVYVYEGGVAMANLKGCFELLSQIISLSFIQF